MRKTLTPEQKAALEECVQVLQRNLERMADAPEPAFSVLMDKIESLGIQGVKPKLVRSMVRAMKKRKESISWSN